MKSKTRFVGKAASRPASKDPQVMESKRRKRVPKPPKRNVYDKYNDN